MSDADRRAYQEHLRRSIERNEADMADRSESRKQRRRERRHSHANESKEEQVPIEEVEDLDA